MAKYYAEADSLVDVDLNKLIIEGRGFGIFSQNFMKIFDSLDPNVLHESKTRYLLLHAYKKIESNRTLYERWRKMLTKHIPSSIPAVSYSDFGFSEMDGFVEGSPCRKFFQKDISFLIEMLADNSSKWEVIGISLNIPDNTLQEIRGLSIITLCGIVCLKKVLVEWIGGTHKYAKAPTVKNLTKALRSKTVGLGTVADSVQSRLDEYLQEPLAKRPCLEASPLEVVFQSRDSITVKEKKSTLLEVQVATSQNDVSYQWIKDGCPLQEGREFLGVHEPILCITDASSVTAGIYTCKIAVCEDSVCSEPVLVEVCYPPFKKVLMDRYSAQPEIPEDSWPPVNNNNYINLALIRQGNVGEYARNTIQGNMDDIIADKEGIKYEEVFSDLESGTRLLIEGRPGSGKTTLIHKFSRDWALGLNLKEITFLFLVHLRGFFNNPNIKLRDIVQKYCVQDVTQEARIDEIVQHASQHNGKGLCFVLDGLDEYSVSKDDTFIFSLIRKELYPEAIVIVASRPAASAQFRKGATKHVEVIGFLKKQIFEYVNGYQFQSDKRGDLCRYLDEHPNVRHMCYLPIHTAMVCYLYDVMGNRLPQTETKMYAEFTKHTLLRTFNKVEGSTYLKSVDDLSPDQKELFARICKLGYEQTILSRQVMKKTEVEHFFKDINSGNESMGLITVDRMASICGFENLYTFLHLTFQEYLAAYHIFKLDKKDQIDIFEKYGKKKHMQVVWKFCCGLIHFNQNRFAELLGLVQLKKDSDLMCIQCAYESQQPIACKHISSSGTLSFQHEYLTALDFVAFSYVLKNSECPITKLTLDNCTFGQDGIAALLEAGISSLKTLRFHGRACVLSQCESLNFFLQKLTSLECLDISNTKIGSKKVESLTSDVVLPNLHTLILSMCSNLKEERVLELLKFNSPKLNKVVVHDMTLNVESLQSFVRAFGFFSILRGMDAVTLTNILGIELYRSEINMYVYPNVKSILKLTKEPPIISEKEWVLADCLQRCNCLQTLSIHDNSIGSDGSKALAEALKCFNQLQTLNFRRNKICQNGMNTLADGVRNCNNLESLYWDSNIGARSVVAFACALERCDKLQNLNLPHNEISPVGAKALVYGLMKHCGKLKVLNLQNNYIGCDGAKALADCLKCCSNLQMLNLDSNNIGPDGARVLSCSLKHCANLQILNLDSNGIDCCAVKALADSLKHCSNLSKLHLWDNDIGSDGAKALIINLVHCNRLQTLNLRCNNIGSEGMKAITDFLMLNDKVMCIY